MSDIATQNTPFAAALAAQAKAYFEPMQAQLGNFMQRADQMLAQVCAQGNANATGMSASTAQQQRVVPGAGGCNSCGGGCAGGRCSFTTQGGGGSAVLYSGGRELPAVEGIQLPPGAAPLMVMPECYSDCEPIDPCLYEFYRMARSRFDEYSWNELLKREIEIVHLDTNVGDGVINQVPAQPLTAGQSAVLVQNGAQQLPWQPGMIKLNAKWNGTAQPEQVFIQFYSGVSGVTNIGDPNAAGLITIGSEYKLSDFECGTDCFLVPFPKIFRCKVNAIPDTRRVYVRVAVGQVGQASLVSYQVTIIKRATASCTKYTNMYQGCLSGKS